MHGEKKHTEEGGKAKWEKTQKRCHACSINYFSIGCFDMVLFLHDCEG